MEDNIVNNIFSWQVSVYQASLLPMDNYDDNVSAGGTRVDIALPAALLERYGISAVTAERRVVDYKAYVAGYMNRPMCEAACRACSRYGATWGCPPFDREVLVKGHYVELEMMRMELATGLEDKLWSELMSALKRILTGRLLERENELGGRAYGLAGKCDLCGDRCTRPMGQMCRHPELVRHSLESVGFDLVKTAAEVFGRPMNWDGRSLTLIVGIVYS